MFSADADASGNRTPCQRFRDLVVPGARADVVAGERPAVCDEVLNVLAGKADSSPANHGEPIRAGGVAVDSGMRVLVTEPSTHTIHILDFAGRKASQIDGTKGDRMSQPFGIAVDGNDNIYVTDLARGRIAVFKADGKFKRYIGTFRDEGLFEFPRSIAIDRATGRIYLADSKRNFVLILDENGKIIAQVGKRGGGSRNAEFMEPTEIALYRNEVFVLDKRNVRIQVLDLDGRFRRQFQLEGSGADSASGMAIDNEGRLLVSILNWVEVFDRQGKRLFRFGESGDKPGEFQETKGVFTDRKDRAYVIDSGNNRIQVFQFINPSRTRIEASR
jgi:DNA-binding beta-propeller fold protein YncE